MTYTIETAVDAADFILSQSDKQEGMVKVWREAALRGTATYGMLEALVDRANKERLRSIAERGHEND